MPRVFVMGSKIYIHVLQFSQLLVPDLIFWGRPESSRATPHPTNPLIFFKKTT